MVPSVLNSRYCKSYIYVTSLKINTPQKSPILLESLLKCLIWRNLIDSHVIKFYYINKEIVYIRLYLPPVAP